MNFCARRTTKLFALTTPNFEYWRNRRALPAYKDCRWIPDHLLYFNPESANPHVHKQEMTEEILDRYLRESEFGEGWKFGIYRAWPWSLHDEARGKTFKMYFKLFVVAVRNGNG